MIRKSVFIRCTVIVPQCASGLNSPVSGRTLGNPESDHLPATGSISEWPVIRRQSAREREFVRTQFKSSMYQPQLPSEDEFIPE